MERSIREFRSEAERLFGAEPRRGACYPERLKRLALEVLKAAQAQGRGVKTVAQELGVHPDTLHAWRKATLPNDALVPVRVIDAQSEHHATPVVIAPGGLRVEGLDIAGVAELLRRLA